MLTWDSLGIPYSSGGQEDQPIGLLEKGRMALNVYRSVKAYTDAMYSGNSSRWINASEDNKKMFEVAVSAIELRNSLKDK